MKRKKNIIDDLSLLMLASLSDGAITDDDILEKTECVDDVNMKGRDGRTLLIHACTYRKPGIAKRLIERNADVNMQDEMGYSALHASVLSKSVDCARLLLENGADVNLCDQIGNVALFFVQRDSVDLLRLLLSHGADFHKKNSYGISTRDTFQAYPEILKILDEYENVGSEGQG